MKKLFLFAFLIPCMAKAQFTISNSSNIDLLDLRTGDWPFSINRTVKGKDTTYIVSFRDQQYPKEVNMSTLKLGNYQQLRFFQQGLQALKDGSTGDVANFKDYSIKRIDLKKDGIKYTLTLPEGDVTDLKQAEADKLIAFIKSM